MLNTMFALVETLECVQGTPRNTGLIFDVVVALAFARIRNFKAVFPPPVSAKGTLKITEKHGVATAIFQRGQGKSERVIMTAVVTAMLAMSGIATPEEMKQLICSLWRSF